MLFAWVYCHLRLAVVHILLKQLPPHRLAVDADALGSWNVCRQTPQERTVRLREYRNLPSAVRLLASDIPARIRARPPGYRPEGSVEEMFIQLSCQRGIRHEALKSRDQPLVHDGSAV